MSRLLLELVFSGNFEIFTAYHVLILTIGLPCVYFCILSSTINWELNMTERYEFTRIYLTSRRTIFHSKSF